VGMPQVRPEQVIGIATDFAACAVLPATWDGTPLCEPPWFADSP
jgi:L-ribulokinase